MTGIEYPDPYVVAWIETALEHNLPDDPVVMSGGLRPERPGSYLECVLEVLDRARTVAPGFSFEAPEVFAQGDVR